MARELAPVDEGQKRLGELLLELGFLDAAQLKTALVRQRQWGKRLGWVLVESGLISEERLVRALSRQLRLDTCDPISATVPAELLERVSREVALELRVVPLAVRSEGGVPVASFATADPLNQAAELQLRALMGAEVRWVLAGETEISLALARHYGTRPPSLVSHLPPSSMPPPALEMDIPTKDMPAGAVFDLPEQILHAVEDAPLEVGEAAADWADEEPTRMGSPEPITSAPPPVVSGPEPPPPEPEGYAPSAPMEPPELPPEEVELFTAEQPLYAPEDVIDILEDAETMAERPTLLAPPPEPIREASAPRPETNGSAFAGSVVVEDALLDEDIDTADFVEDSPIAEIAVDNVESQLPRRATRDAHEAPSREAGAAVSRMLWRVVAGDPLDAAERDWFLRVLASIALDEGWFDDGRIARAIERIGEPPG